MPKGPSVEEAVERARQVQEDRIRTIESVARQRQNLADVHTATDRELAELQAQIADRIREAERADVKAFNAALSAGWTVDELRKIGFGEPAKKSRAKRRTTRKSPDKQTGSQSTETAAEASPDADTGAQV